MTDARVAEDAGRASRAGLARQSRRVRKGRYLGAVLLLVCVAFLWTPAGQVHVKATLLLLQALPQVPVKPLSVLSNAPVHQRIVLASTHGPIVADLFRPVPRFGTIQPHTKPALMLALGVRTKPRDRTLILSFAQTMSRLGYVVLWPRLQALDRGMPLLESPETFVLGVRYLKDVDLVDRHRITIFGFSVGASLALVAATNQQIAQEVHALVFFGGYYDIFAYLTSLATQTSSIDGKTTAWHPDREAVELVHDLLRHEHAGAITRVFAARTQAEAAAILRAAPASELATLRQVSPSYHIKDFRAHIFILHDKGDHFVPYVESAKLNQALGSRVGKTYLISNLFEHTQPKVGLSWHIIQDATALYSYTVSFFSVAS